jgi:hypothetical protein
MPGSGPRKRDADPDPTFQLDTDLDPTFDFIQIWIRLSDPTL